MSEPNPNADAPSGRFLRMQDLAVGVSKPGQPPMKGQLGLSQATINRLTRLGEFPPKRRLSKRCIGWWESDIERWKAGREAIPPRGS